MHKKDQGDQSFPVLENTAWFKSFKPLNKNSCTLLKACSTETFSCQKLQEAICMCVSQAACLFMGALLPAESPLSTLLGDALKNSKTCSQSFPRKEYIYNKRGHGSSWTTSVHQTFCTRWRSNLALSLQKRFQTARPLMLLNISTV